MEELQISGKRYISSRRAAKEHKYHSDYIGQLVRAGKVAGQKVGRAWYVDAISLSAYLGKETGADVVVDDVDVLKQNAATTIVQATEAVHVSPQVIEPVRAEEVIETNIVEERAVEPIPAITVEKAVVVEEPQEVVQEVHRVPIHNPSSFTVRVVPEKKNNKLTYVVDDAPMLPQVHERNNYTEIDMRAQEAAVFNATYEQPETIKKSGHRSGSSVLFRQLKVVAVVGVFVLLVAVTASYFLTYTATVNGGDMTASVTFGGLK